MTKYDTLKTNLYYYLLLNLMHCKKTELLQTYPLHTLGSLDGRHVYIIRAPTTTLLGAMLQGTNREINNNKEISMVHLV